jgi:hypothetical protein
MKDTILSILHEFIDSGYKGVKVDGMREIIQEVANKYELPVEVLERRNVLYLRRTDVE